MSRSATHVLLVLLFVVHGSLMGCASTQTPGPTRTAEAGEVRPVEQAARDDTIIDLEIQNAPPQDVHITVDDQWVEAQEPVVSFAVRPGVHRVNAEYEDKRISELVKADGEGQHLVAKFPAAGDSKDDALLPARQVVGWVVMVVLSPLARR